MRPLLLLAVLLSCPAAAAVPAAPDAQADWRRDGVDERAKAALTGLGWRLEDDGRALDPRTKAPAAKAVLDKAVLDLRQDARRAALETVTLMLASGRPLGAADKRKLAFLSEDLPAALVAAMSDPRSDLNAAKAMAGAELSVAAAYFDGGRTLADRRAAAEPVSAGEPGARPALPYYTALEQSAGDKLRAAAEAELGRDPFGATVLSRLAGRDGRPELPPIAIEDQDGGIVAHYDFRRGAVVLDREAVLASVVATAPPSRAAALRAALIPRDALVAYLAAHPDAAAAVVKGNDAVLVHELTHAWQDRRDPVFREIARGNLPDAQPLEYEEEAYAAKNLYLHSKLVHAPASVPPGPELSDYVAMMRSRGAWKRTLFMDLNDASPSRALPLRSIEDVQRGRVAGVEARAAASAGDQQAKALDLLAMGRGQRELARLRTAHRARMSEINREIDLAGSSHFYTLGNYYLVQARLASRAADRSALLERAHDYALASANVSLIEQVRKEREKKR